MTKLHILSDLHLEFSTFEPPATDADIIILAGDISKAGLGILWARSAFPDKKIVYVPGNHEFYNHERVDTLARMRSTALKEDVYLLDEDEMVIGGVRFLGCTLWTDFLLFGKGKKELAMNAGLEGLNDFRIIYDGYAVYKKRLAIFTPVRSVELHEKSLAWIKAKLDEPFDGKTVVVTHHLPSKQSVVDRYKDDLLSACFASELGYLFGKMDLWVHGHTHDNLNYEANGTRVICNPRGYVTYRGQENFDFKPGLVIEI